MRIEHFPQILERRARETPDAIACRFFKGPSPVPETWTFRGLRDAAATLAARLVAHDLAGERVLLLCASQQRFVVAFYACLIAGAVAVPTAPPRRAVLHERLDVILRDARARGILHDVDGVDGCGDATLVRLDLRARAARMAALAVPERTDGAAPAFLQYTSGSTGDPKGVVVTHDNLVHNSAVIAAAMGVSAQSSIFTALPLYHDMGLVGGVLQMMYVGCPAGFMAPAEFVQYPERWLQIVSRWRVTTSGGPNFMYELAARAIRPEQLDGVDLSSWRVAFCGAEPIRAATVARFAERYAPLGYRPEAFYACYGMAEATLFVAGGRVDAAPTVVDHEHGALVGCGTAHGDTEIAIVDPDACRRVPQGASGEIWVRGASVAAGYWMRPELTRRTFGATLDGDADGAPWLRTGDVGFVRDGELFVAGRVKDLVILHGRKYAPQDLEEACERAHAALRPACGAAFDVPHDGGAKLVIAFELRREWLRRVADWPEVRRAVQTAIGAQFGVSAADLVLLMPGALPRTSSGKVRRAQCRADYLSDRLQRAAPRAERAA
jgi:acyl-CoA synthetase (AMP-forming)/AMP-acid ligase II